jgi:hypothetical protein
MLQSVYVVNTRFNVITSGAIYAEGGIEQRGDPGKNTPQAYLFFIWIAALHDSAL